MDEMRSESSVATRCIVAAAGRRKKETNPFASIERKLTNLRKTCGAINEQVTILARQEGGQVYYITPSGRKLHRSEDCSGLTSTASDVEELVVNDDVDAFFGRIGAVCTRCNRE